MKKIIVIKMALGAIGAIYIFFGVSALISNFIYLINGHPVFEVIAPIKILTVLYYIYLLYIAIVGWGIYREKIWVSKGIVVTPFLFVIFEHFFEQRVEKTSYLIFLLFFIFSAIFLNIKTIKTYLNQKNKKDNGVK
jgi:hypothetical protein